MPQANWENFHQLVLARPELQQRLRPIADWGAFLEAVVRLGAEQGYHFSAQDVQAAANARRRAWLERWI